MVQEELNSEKKLRQIVEPLLEWYRANRRVLPWRKNKDAYAVWVSEIMLQQTRVETVIPYYERFMARCPDVEALAACEEEELLKLWEGLGYYSRVKNMKKAACKVCEEYNGKFPEELEQLQKLPGIGAYTAGAIASIAFEKAAAAVDGNVLRVVTRLLQDDTDITDIQFRHKITTVLQKVYPKQGCGDFTQSLMELGATICVPNGMPKCIACPIRCVCEAYQNLTQTQYPVKKKKKDRKVQEKTVLLIQYQDNIALNKRSEKGLLAGMWELPNLDGYKTDQEIEKELISYGIVVDKIGSPKSTDKVIRHIFTHIEWNMICKIIECAEVAQDNPFTWVSREQIRTHISLPAAFQKVYRYLPDKV